MLATVELITDLDIRIRFARDWQPLSQIVQDKSNKIGIVARNQLSGRLFTCVVLASCFSLPLYIP
jgi:hypothetical protein